MSMRASHPDIVKRLRGAEVHLKSIVAMFEDGRSCLDIALQLQAVEGALGHAKKALVRDRIDPYVELAVRKGTRSIEDSIGEFRTITKYL